MKRRVLAMSLAVVLACGQLMVVNADTIDEVKQKKAQTSSQLEATKDKINNLETQKKQLTSEISTLDAKLVETITSINSLKDSIAETTAQIEDTKVKLAASEQERDEQYEAMKKRIQFLYENGGTGSWATTLLSGESIGDMMNSVSQTQELYDYDKQALDEYIKVVQEVTDLGEQLENEKADLQLMENEQEAEQKNLESMIDQKKAASADYENQIEAARGIADKYRKLIEQQNQEIEKLVAEQQRQAEEARKKAEAEEAARQKEAERVNQQKVSSKTKDAVANSASSNKPSSSNNGNSEVSTDNSSSKPESSGNGSSKPSSNESSKPSNNESSKPSGGTSSSTSGQAIINYAMQFVGNPYVWGGTSLTNGADCSGFVMSVYAHFGYSLPRSSGEQRSVGRSVSYADAQPGDIICYDGHVALYMGGGSIVHASNSKPYPQGGIKVSSNANYKTILSVRRVV